MHCIFLRPTNLAGRQQPASTDSSRHRAAFQASQLHYPTSNRSLGADSIFTLRAKPPSHLVAHVADVAEHVLDKGQRRVTRAEGGHDLASIWLHAHRIESWHLKALGRRNQAEDTIIARRPLLTSARSAFSLRSGVILEVKPNGSHRLSGTGCGNLPFSAGK